MTYLENPVLRLFLKLIFYRQLSFCAGISTSPAYPPTNDYLFHAKEVHLTMIKQQGTLPSDGGVGIRLAPMMIQSSWKVHQFPQKLKRNLTNTN
jgi:hypothetical protein